MSAVLADACTCGSIGNTNGVRLCIPCHRYWRNDRELDSVSSVIRACWPLKKSFDGADPAVLENARQRGVEVDAMFSAYIAGTLMKIPAGTREDAVTLFFRLKQYADTAGLKGASQVILADDAIAGTADFIDESRVIWDVKTVYNLDISYELQLGMYGLLYEAMHGEPPAGLGIIHVTERFQTPRIVPLDAKQCMTDAAHLRAVWLASKRRRR